MEFQHCTLAYGDNERGRCTWCGDPLPPRRRRFCSASCSSDFGVNHYWPNARLGALARAAYACEDPYCSVSEATGRIEVHHLAAPVGGRRRYAMGCHNHQDRLLVLCDGHHMNETRWERANGRPVQLQLIA